MSEAPVTPAVATPESPAAAPTPPATPGASASPAAPSPTASAPDAPAANVWENPEAAKAEIEKLRKENGAARTNAKAQAADEAKKELSQQIAKALGIVTDEAPTPEQLTENLTTAQAEAKQARVELAVYRTAATAGADPAALLDSASFLASLATVDPSDTAAVTAAIQSAVTTNPRLGAATGDPRPPAPNPAQGASASGAAGVAQLGQADLARMSPEQIAAAEASGQFDGLLGR